MAADYKLKADRVTCAPMRGGFGGKESVIAWPHFLTRRRRQAVGVGIPLDKAGSEGQKKMLARKCDLTVLRVSMASITAKR